MKANELMIGDIVTFKDCLESGPICPIKIAGLHSYDNIFLGYIDGDSALDELELNDEIVGIPLTPEILKKNGFVYSDLPFINGWEQYGLFLYPAGEGYRINCGQNVSMVIDTVHQLQHALKLCGIDKTIEL